MKFPGICFILRADKVKSYEEKTQEEGNMKERKVRFRHIEEMKEFVSAACRCDFDIDIVSDRLVVDGKSILGVLSLSCDQDLHVRYDGTEPHFEEVLGKYAVA